MTTEVLAIYENTSEKLLDLFEKHCDLLRNATLHCNVQFPCSSSTNLQARLIQQRYKQTIINARYDILLNSSLRGHSKSCNTFFSQKADANHVACRNAWPNPLRSCNPPPVIINGAAAVEYASSDVSDRTEDASGFKLSGLSMFAHGQCMPRGSHMHVVVPVSYFVFRKLWFEICIAVSYKSFRYSIVGTVDRPKPWSGYLPNFPSVLSRTAAAHT